MDSNIVRKHANQNASLHYPASDMLNRKPNRYIRITGGDSGDAMCDCQDWDRVDRKPVELKALQEELFEYRHMLDKLVRERTARLERRILILKYCHDNLGMRHNKLSQMYRDLLLKTKSLESNISV
ncbi:MAG: hypothetical protein WA632_08945 [Gallionella sp.]